MNKNHKYYLRRRDAFGMAWKFFLLSFIGAQIDVVIQEAKGEQDLLEFVVSDDL